MSDMSGRRNALLGRINHFLFPHVGQSDLQLLAGSRHAGRNRLLGNAQRCRDLPVAVAVVVAHHQRGRLFGWKLAQLPDQVRALGKGGRIWRRRGTAEPLDELAGLA
ncbi:MAG TPA: hypothetical protein VN965_00810 [Candidatus Dormibacteraeota bacterium]|nr:hypothetical protein [Candidatus Dormibacteraeota bacterium]